MGWSGKLSSLAFSWNKLRRNTVFHYLIYELQALERSSYPWDALKRDCSYPAIRQKLLEPAIPWPPESLMFHTVRICWIPLFESFCCCCWNPKFTNVIIVTPLLQSNPTAFSSKSRGRRGQMIPFLCATSFYIVDARGDHPSAFFTLNNPKKLSLSSEATFGKKPSTLLAPFATSPTGAHFSSLSSPPNKHTATAKVSPRLHKEDECPSSFYMQCHLPCPQDVWFFPQTRFVFSYCSAKVLSDPFS